MTVLVIGAGVSGAHAALTLLERGHSVELWDVGRQEDRFSHPGLTLHSLKEEIEDPISFFLSDNFSAVIPPNDEDLFRYPPSRKFFVSSEDPLWDYFSDSFYPYGSYNKGGLANGWGANALAYDDDDLSDWPVSFSEMENAYRIAYKRVPVAGPLNDDLTSYLQGVYPSQPEVGMSSQDEHFLEAYKSKKRQLEKIGIRMGRARLAVITKTGARDACDYCDRCLWGCPRESIYNPVSSTLKECESHNNFRYIPNRFVISLLSREDRITEVRYLNTESREIEHQTCEAVFLAAGALQTGAIYLRSLKAARPEVSIASEGLMDTSVIKIPFVMLNRVGQSGDSRAFQFNRLIMGLVNGCNPWPRYLHGEILFLTSLLYHPLIEKLPFDSRLSKRLFFTIKSALGVVSLFFPDKVRSENRQVISDQGKDWEKVKLYYQESAHKKTYMRQSVAKVRSALWQMGCIPWRATRSPLGSGIHYAGTVPMGEGIKRCDSKGRSNLFRNLFIADGASFPSLPSKSITMSLAAHATRVATNAHL